MKQAFAVALFAFLLVPAPALAADKRPPKISGAIMLDADADGRADGVLVTFSEKIRHAKDTKKPFPLTVAGYTVTRVGKASGRTVLVKLKEKAAADHAAKPKVRYKRTKSKPVRDRAGNQARKQTFAGTLAHGRDRDGDGYPSPADCAPDAGSIHPGAIDLPDSDFVDTNCDGVDGDKALSIFVATGGVDDALCGEFGDPCLTLQRGMDEAQARDRPDVLVQLGTYTGPFTLQSGVSVHGKYGATWQRSLVNVTTLTGGKAANGQWLTVAATGLSEPVTLDALTVVGPDVPGGTEAGKSSYAVYVLGSTLTLDRVDVSAGDGAPGNTGTMGGSATQVTPAKGQDGGPGDEYFSACDIDSKGLGGSGGTNPTAPSGGAGGDGGPMDTSCTCSLGVCVCAGTSGCNARPGLRGLPTNLAVGAPGSGGPGGALDEACPSALSSGQNGQPGVVSNGPAGQAGNASQVVSGFWTADPGGTGGLGAHGGGGGGGGGAAGCDAGTLDAYGPGGGGGGAGGLRAPTTGGGGTGGGGSFGLFAASATVIVRDSAITRGDGGNGGVGGAGGAGQPGGAGGEPGAPEDSGTAGHGGAGGHGGHSGGGGGGQGGISAGVYSLLSTITVNPGTTITGGSAGIGGPGGAAGGSGGNAGQAGAAGALLLVGTCQQATHC